MSRRDHVRAGRKIRRLRKKKGGWLRLWAAGILKGGLSLAMMASLTFLGFTLYRYFQLCGQLHIGEIKVMGCLNTTESELLKMARVNLQANLTDLDLKGVSARLAEHPWVKMVKVRRDWAGNALVIEVQERSPRALILFEDLYLVDCQGEIFKKAEPGDRLDFPILTGLQRQEAMGGNEQAKDLIRQALGLIELLEQRKVFTALAVSEIHLSKQNGLTVLTLNGGIPIRLGSGGLSEKINRLEKVLPDLRQKAGGVEYVDLNYLKKVVVKMKETEKGKSRSS